MITKSGKPGKAESPSTIARSDKHAQQTFAEPHDATADEYDDGALIRNRVAPDERSKLGMT